MIPPPSTIKPGIFLAPPLTISDVGASQRAQNPLSENRLASVVPGGTPAALDNNARHDSHHRPIKS